MAYVRVTYTRLFERCHDALRLIEHRLQLLDSVQWCRVWLWLCCELLLELDDLRLQRRYKWILARLAIQMQGIDGSSSKGIIYQVVGVIDPRLTLKKLYCYARACQLCEVRPKLLYRNLIRFG